MKVPQVGCVGFSVQPKSLPQETEDNCVHNLSPANPSLLQQLSPGSCGSYLEKIHNGRSKSPKANRIDGLSRVFFLGCRMETFPSH